MEENTNNLKNLLQNVAIIQKKYDEIAKITGENFNIFSIMSMENSERYTHSAIIAELLNPKGSHYHGNIFLKLFFTEVIKIENCDNLDLDNAIVLIEEYIGEINTDYTIGGYIDIVIKYNNGSVIVIENKINANDQRGQLLRYKNAYKDCDLIYLTKDGKPPSKESYHIDDQNKIDLEDVILISYEKNIKNWLEKCHKESIEQPMLREIIKQYLNLIKKITNQTVNNDMSDEIRNLINEENVDLIFKINSELNSIISEVKSKLFNIKFPDIVINNESKIKVVFEEDGGEVFIGYQYFKNNENQSSIHFNGEYFNIINEINKNKTFTAQSNFAWYYPVGFNNGDRFINIGNKEIIKMYKNPTYFNEFVEKIINEEKEIRDQFEKIINIKL